MIMPEIPSGWTKATIWQKYQELREDADHLREDRAELEQLLADEDPEARATGQCINALDAMLTAMVNTFRPDQDRTVSASLEDTDRPAALASPVGRVLLHLAARFDVDLVAPRPPVPEEPETLADQGDALLVVPQRLAASIEQLVHEHPWLTDEVRPR